MTLFQYRERANSQGADDDLPQALQPPSSSDSAASSLMDDASDDDRDALTEGSASLASPLSSPIPALDPLSPTPPSFSLLDPDCRLCDFELEQLIGRGSFSEVFRVRRRRPSSLGLLDLIRGRRDDEDDGSDRFALIKGLKPVIGVTERQRVMRHGRHLSLLASHPVLTAPPSPSSLDSPVRPLSSPAWHPNILRHYALWLEDSSVYRLTDLYPLGDLVSFFQQPRSEAVVWALLLHIAQALLHLSSLGLLHFDVKPSNCLVQPLPHSPSSLCPFRFVLADLGTMIHLTDWPAAVDSEGDGQFLAPEVLTASHLTSAVDVYALGCTAYACCTGRAVERGGGGRKLTWEDARCAPSLELRDCIRRMTEVRVEDRIGLQEVITRARQRVEDK